MVIPETTDWSPVLQESSPDPIFAAIAMRQATLEELIAAALVHDTLWETMSPEAKRRPYVMTGGSAAFDHTQIDELIDTSIDHMSDKWGKFLDATQLERMRADRHAKLDAEWEAVAIVQRECGYSAVKSRLDAAQVADNEALRVVCQTIPTTLRGIAALASWVNEKFEDLASLDSGKALAEVLANLKLTIRTIASRARRISGSPTAS